MTGRAKVGFLAAAVIAATSGRAAAAEPRPTLPPSDAEVLIPAREHGGWVGPVAQATTVRKRAAMLVGARGGWLIDRQLTLGGGGFGLTSRVPAPPGAAGLAGDHDLRMGYGGFWGEYTFAPVEILHVSVGVLLGGGEVALTRRGGAGTFARERFLVGEPSTSVELNLTRFVRVDFGVSYRWIAGAATATISDADVSGFALVAALKLGKF